MHKLKIILYYLLIAKLPHSRLMEFSNVIRVWYLSNILDILPYDSKTKFEFGVYISDGKKLKFGKNVRINENVFLQGDIQIGNDVMIAPNVAIYTNSHKFNNANIPMVNQGVTLSKKVVIEDDVWLGRNVMILPGIKIEKGSIVGANSVVTKNIPKHSIYGGVPAKLIKSRI